MSKGNKQNMHTGTSKPEAKFKSHAAHGSHPASHTTSAGRASPMTSANAAHGARRVKRGA